MIANYYFTESEQKKILSSLVALFGYYLRELIKA